MPTTPPTIDTAPEIPKRGVKETFGILVDAFNTWFALAATQIVAMGANVYANAVEAFGYSTAAGASASAAAASAEIAADSAAAAAVTTGATLWVSGQSVAQDAAKISPLDRRTYRRKTATGSGTTDPALDPTNYVLLSVGIPYTVLRVREEYSSGTDGPTVAASATATATRALNTTKTNTIAGASVSSNQVTLPAGQYEIDAFAGVNGGSIKSRIFLYCITDAVIVLTGKSTDTYNAESLAVLRGEVTISSGTKVYELRHYVSNSSGSTGLLGRAISQASQAEVHSELCIKKVG